MATVVPIRQAYRDNPVSVATAAPIDGQVRQIISDDKRMNQRLRDMRTRQEEHDNTDGMNSPVTTMVGWLHEHFRVNRQYKVQQGIQRDLIEAERHMKGEYTCAQRMEMDDSMDPPWYPLTEMMVNRMHAFLRDTLADDREHPRYDFRASTIPEAPAFLLESLAQQLEQEVLLLLEAGMVVTPQQLQQVIDAYSERLYERLSEAANESAQRRKRLVDDKLEQSNYRRVFDAALRDMILYGTGLIYGPFPSLELRPAFTSDDSEFSPEDELELDPKWEYRKTAQFRVLDPLRLFPSPCTTDGNDGLGWFYMDKMTTDELYRASLCPGWIKENIELILNEESDGYKDWAAHLWRESDYLRNMHSEHNPGYDVLWYVGKVQGSLLKEMGMKRAGGRPIVAYADYEIEIHMIRDVIVKVSCSNDLKGHRLLHKANMYDCPMAFWGRGVYHLTKDKQRIINRSLISLTEDLGYSALPMFERDSGLLNDKDNAIFPGAVFDKDTSDTGIAGNAVTVHQIRSNASTFIAMIRDFIEQTELMLGLPRFLTGATSASGAARTASGLQQLQSNAFVNVKSIIVNIDHGWTHSAMGALDRLCMATNRDPALVGDVEVITMGATAMLARQVNRDNLFAQFGALFPLMQAGIIPVAVIHQIAREILLSMGIDTSSTWPTGDIQQAQAIVQQAQLAQAQGINGGVAGAAQNGGTASPGADFGAQQAGGQQGGFAAAPGQPF